MGDPARAVALKAAVAIVMSASSSSPEQRNTAALSALAHFLIVKYGSKAVRALCAPQHAQAGPHGRAPHQQAVGGYPSTVLPMMAAHVFRGPQGMMYAPSPMPYGMVRRTSRSPGIEAQPCRLRAGSTCGTCGAAWRSSLTAPPLSPQMPMQARGAYFSAMPHGGAPAMAAHFHPGAPAMGYGMMAPAGPAVLGGAGGVAPTRRGPGPMGGPGVSHFMLQQSQPPPYYDAMQQQLVNGARACSPRTAQQCPSRTLERALSRVRSRGGSRNVGFSFKCAHSPSPGCGWPTRARGVALS